MVKYSRAGDWDSELIDEVETRAYRAGLVAGAVSLVAALGTVKDLYALLKPSGRGNSCLDF